MAKVKHGPRPGPGVMTARQIEVLGYLVNGLSDKQIGALLNVKATTIQSHMTRACSRIGASNRVHLAALAVKRGLVEVNANNGPLLADVLAATKRSANG